MNSRKTIETISVNTDAPQQKEEVQKEEPQNPLPCPECGEDLGFMGRNNEELKEPLTCPLCGKEILLNQ